eukprot:TRINITY_DN13125_c0_g3_i1.p1 TRINITY_DN13125_c0_g3~~TRINITY_DN13125_c0_g3_i1.p1  ORF type:complete len:740 (+),score=134.00 TRINITY_DN13125_c0_g3_i1:49-2268(+)
MAQPMTTTPLANVGTTHSFKSLLVQLAEAHERETGALRSQIKAYEEVLPREILNRKTAPPGGPGGEPPILMMGGHSAGMQDQKEGIIQRAARPPHLAGGVGDCEASNKEIKTDTKTDGVDAEDVMKEGDERISMKGAWTQIPPRFAIVSQKTHQKLNRRVLAAPEAIKDGGSEIPDSAESRKECVIDPGSTPRLVWDVCGMFLIGYDMVTIPMLAYSPEENGFTIFMGWLAMLFWTGDMFASVNTGYRLPDGNLVMDRKRIITNYVKTWLVVDLLVVVPDWTVTILELAGSGGGGSANVASMTRLLRVLRTTRILRLFRLFKLKKLVVLIYDMISSEHIFIIVNLVRLIFVVLAMNHYVACVWYALGELSRAYGSDTSLNWLEDVGKTPVYGQSLGWRYATSLHWSITQFTPASMDVFAVNLVERVFSIGILFFSLVSLSSIIGSVSASMTQLRNLSSDNTKQFWLLRRYLKENRIDWDLRERILRYAEHKTEAQSSKTPASKVALLNALSDPLKREISTSLYSPALVAHAFFNHIKQYMPKIMQRICKETIQPFSLAEGDVVFRANEEANFMYFLKSGFFNYTLAGKKEARDPPLGAKEWVCEMVLWAQWRYRGDLVAKESGDLIYVDPAAFAATMRLHPRPWHFGCAYAGKIVRYVNAQDPSELTDMTFDDEVSRFIQDSDIFDDNGGQRAPSDDEEEDVASPHVMRDSLASAMTSAESGLQNKKMNIPGIVEETDQ